MDHRHVVNHRYFETEEYTARIILDEASRFLPGEVKPLQEMRGRDLDGIIIPGGMGPAKNLTSFVKSARKYTISSESLPLLPLVLDGVQSCPTDAAQYSFM